jgi:hypothetical protein
MNDFMIEREEAKREQLKAEGKPLCERCNGSGNEFFFKYKRCSACEGKGWIKEEWIMTKKDAIRMFESKWWKKKTAKEIVEFQLYEKKLCMPFDEFHKAIEEIFERPVWTHEFAYWEKLKKEYKDKKKPNMKEIMELIPKEKMILVNIEERQ